MRPGSRYGYESRRGISIHAPLTGCDYIARTGDALGNDISIHAPLTGCDVSVHTYILYVVVISIHAPLTGCDAVADSREV